MRALLILALAAACSVAVAKGGGKSGGSHTVHGHVTKNGTYVPPHQRSNPNDSKTDNWSSKGNSNPYTGKEGTKDPFAPPSRP
jgi:hypothetical protein